MRVSVIINTIDRATSLRTALESLRRQNYPDFEVIVVNGPSTDSTAEVLEDYRGFIRAGSIEARNLAISRNAGVEMAQGDVVAFMDDDAVADENWLADAVAGFDSDEVAGVCGFVYDHTGYNFQFRYSMCDRRGRGIHDIVAPVGEQFCYPGVTVFPYLTGGNAIFRRSALLEVGAFDEEYEYYLEETDLCLRLIEAGYLLKQLSNAFVYHRCLGSNMRQTNRVVTNVLPIIKNKIYFAFKHNQPGMSYREMVDEWKRSTDEIEEGHKYFVRARQTPPETLERFHQDADLGFRQGIERGLNQPRRLIHTEIAKKLRGRRDLDILDPENPGKFKPYPTLLPKSQKLTICFLSQQYPPGIIEGIARMTHDLACGLAALGHNVHVLTRNVEGLNTVDFEQGVWVHRITLDRIEPPSPPGVRVPHGAWQWSARFLRELHRIHAIHPVDIVEGPIWQVEGIAVLTDGNFRVVTNLETPMKVVAETNPDFLDGSPQSLEDHEKYCAAETLMMQRSTAVRAISRAIVETMRKYYGVEFSPERLAVFPLGMEDRSPGKISEKEGSLIDVLFVGRLEGRKGVDVLFEVIPSLCQKHPKARFFFVGEDRVQRDGKTFSEKFREQRANARFRDRVLFLGKLPDAELEKHLAQCDIFVSPSRYESFGLVFLEAMMFAKPAVGCRSGGMKEIVEDGVTGLLAEPGNAETLREALDALLSDPAKRESFGEAARQRYLQFYTREILIENALGFYRRVAQSTVPQPSQASPFANAASDSLSYGEALRVFESGRIQEAIELFEKAIRERETSEAWNDWASAVHLTGDLAGAEKGFRRALELDRSSQQAAANLGVLLVNAGRPEEAITYLYRSLPGADEAQRPGIEDYIQQCRRILAERQISSRGAEYQTPAN